MNVYFLLTVLIGVAAFAIVQYLDYRRTQAIKAIAHQLGFTHRQTPQPGFFYRETPGQFIDNRIRESVLCSRGRHRRLENVIEGKWKNQQLLVGDYAYTTGSGKNKSTHRQTIVVIDCAQPYLPPFALVPENIFHKISNFLGYTDINFNNYPQFSKRYRLTGPDEPAIRNCFTSDVLTFFEKHGSFCVESLGTVLLYYKRGYLVKPQEWQKLMNTACRVYSQF